MRVGGRGAERDAMQGRCELPAHSISTPFPWFLGAVSGIIKAPAGVLTRRLLSYFCDAYRDG
jgi:hypothetical protein